uniref:Uncharacterized protein n=1 Tax=Mola mola TaxID=94237 RepID=A0A3Q4BUY5_MOLML
MRVVVLALTLALAGEFDFSPEFAAGKTYVYKYETLLLGGLPEEGLAKAGLKVSSKVLISAEAENMYIMKIMDPELYELSGILPKEPFIPAPRLTSALAVQLMTPIKFEYTNGVVGKMFAPEGISTMVLNIYRGILNVLQLNIKQTHNIYEMQEPGAQGVCKILYAISEDEKADRVLVKKKGLAYTEKCAKCQQDSKNLRGTTAYNYILKRVANGILILEADVNELIQYSPFTEMNGAFQMQTKQSLVFLETQRTTLAPIEAQYFRRGSLKYEFSNELLQTPILLIKINNVQAQIVEILKYMITNNVERVHEDAPLKFLELIQLLRSARFEDLEMLWSQYRSKPDYRQWILDAIPAIGSPAALRFIKEKLLADELSVAEVAQALIASMHMVTANIETIKLVEALTLNNKIVENPFLREIVLLGYGTMVSKYCKILISHFHQQPIHKLLAEAVAKVDMQEIIVQLKVLGNAGHPSSIKPITKILPIHGTMGVSLPVRVHAEAIMALRNIAKKQPTQVQDLALQLYMDKALNPELRMLACIVLFETRPAVGLVTTLANIVKTEENLQVASFTYSHMKSLTRSTAAIHASVAAACNVAVKILNPKLNRLSYRFSKASHMDFYNSPLMLGAAASTFYINDAATIMPRALVARTSAYLAGAAADVLEVGIRTEGLQEALLKNPALIENVDRITKMKRVIKALSQLRSLPASTALASIYVKLFGQEIAFANIDKALIDQAIALATGPSVQRVGKDVIREMLSGASLRIFKPLLASEVRRILPTAAGFPMELSLYTAAVAAATVRVKATTTPALPEDFHFAQLLKTDIQLETEIRPSIALNTFAVMGVNTAMVQAAMLSRAKFNSIVPANIAARIDINEGIFKIEALPVSVPEDIAAVHVETFAVARNTEDLTPARITPIIPAKVLEPILEETSKIADSLVSIKYCSQSSEINIVADAEPIRMPKALRFEKKYCAKAVAIGLKGCLKVATNNIASSYLQLNMLSVEGEDVEKLELEVVVGSKAAERLIKQINMSEEEIIEEKPVLKKLKKILASKENSTSSSSSRSSISSRSSSSASSRVSSSSLSSSRSASRFSSSASSLASLFKPPVFAIMVLAVRANNKVEGYQLAVYIDKPTSRLQIVLAALAADNNWKLCIDGALLSKHKVTAEIGMGAACKEYNTRITAETGLIGTSPAARLRVAWNELPYAIKHVAKRVWNNIPTSMLPSIIREKKMNSLNQLSFTVVATSARSLDFIFETPTNTVYKLALVLPIALPLDEIKGLTPFDEVVDKVHYVFAKASAAECSFSQDTLTTFNSRRYKAEMPLSCYHVLAQDCTDELKFIVLLKKDHVEQKHINVKIADIDIDLYTNMLVKVNGMEIPINNLPYQHPIAKIQIWPSGEGVSVYAPSLGLHEVYMDKNSWRVKVVDWMKGKTCGLCGRADGEVRQEFQTPSGRLTKNAVSYAHSWILPAESCRDTSECRMKLESVQLERQMFVHGQESKCFSVEPVLHCLPGCFPERTTEVTVGYHCVPADSYLNLSESIYEKSIDLREKTEAHLACRCTSQCA